MKRGKPTQSRIRTNNSAIENVKHNVSSSDEEKKRRIQELVAGQEFIDNWNNNHVGKLGMDGKDLVKHFNNVQLDNNYMVIQMYMENPIKSLMINEDTNQIISIDYGVQQIDARHRNTDVAKWVPTPFPVIDKGVIMAISPQVQLYYYELKEKLAKYDKIAADKIIIPEVGDVVYTNHFLFKDTRYYVDKQVKCEDFVKNQEELRLNNFDFLFKVTNYEIESIVKRDKKDDLYDNYKALDTRATKISLSALNNSEESNEEYEVTTSK